jgi:hypothetical protein
MVVSLFRAFPVLMALRFSDPVIAGGRPSRPVSTVSSMMGTVPVPARPRLPTRPGPQAALEPAHLSVRISKRKHGGIQLRRLFGGLLRFGPRLLVAAQTVVQDGGCTLRPLDD